MFCGDDPSFWQTNSWQLLNGSVCSTSGTRPLSQEMMTQKNLPKHIGLSKTVGTFNSFDYHYPWRLSKLTECLHVKRSAFVKTNPKTVLTCIDLFCGFKGWTLLKFNSQFGKSWKYHVHLAARALAQSLLADDSAIILRPIPDPLVYHHTILKDNGGTLW
jgi:hypothetical protein